MEQPLLNTVAQAAQGPHVAAMSADALSAQIGELVDLHAVSIAESHGLELSSASQDVGIAR